MDRKNYRKRNGRVHITTFKSKIVFTELRIPNRSFRSIRPDDQVSKLILILCFDFIIVSMGKKGVLLDNGKAARSSMDLYWKAAQNKKKNNTEKK